MPTPEELARQNIDASLVVCANLGHQAMADWSSSDKTLSEGKARRVSAGSANQFQQFVTPDGRKFTELYNVQHLTSNKLDGVCRVTICTIQRLYAMLRFLFFGMKHRCHSASSREETGDALRKRLPAHPCLQQ